MSWKNYPLGIADFLAANRISKVGHGGGGSFLFAGERKQAVKKKKKKVVHDYVSHAKSTHKKLAQSKTHNIDAPSSKGS